MNILDERLRPMYIYIKKYLSKTSKWEPQTRESPTNSSSTQINGPPHNFHQLFVNNTFIGTRREMILIKDSLLN